MYELIYDAATTSEAPRYALGLGLGALVLVTAWSAWLRYNGGAIHAGVKFLGLMAVILFALSIAYRVEQQSIARKADSPEGRTVEGPITGHWTQRERRAGSTHSYWEWEGFSVGGVPFVYARNVEQNYFHNGGSAAIDLREGMRVRVRYVQSERGGKVSQDIVRFEVAAEFELAD